MTLSPVLHVASRQWMLGQIDDHVAKPLTQDEIEAHIAEYEALVEQVRLLEAWYRDVRIEHTQLLMAVAQKFPNETRHQTALRYIMEREAAACAGDSQTGAAPSTPPPSTSGTVETQGAGAAESQGTPAP